MNLTVCICSFLPMNLQTETAVSVYVRFKEQLSEHKAVSIFYMLADYARKLDFNWECYIMFSPGYIPDRVLNLREES